MQPMTRNTKGDNAQHQQAFERGFRDQMAQTMPGSMLEDDDDSPEAKLKHLRDTFLLNLIAKRKEAVAGRSSSGIELEWSEDEEHYQGIDDANRAFHAANQLYRTSKSMLLGAGTAGSPATPARSVVFLNITRSYVDAASARVADMLLPTDDRAWAIKPTPIPKLTPYLMQQLRDRMGMGVLYSPEVMRQFVQEQVENAKAASKKMEEAIDDCLVESNWHGEMRQVIEDSGRLGAGVFKGPFPVRRVARMTQRDPVTGQTKFVRLSEIKPGSKRIDPWNFFPDPACGENIHNGSYTWEREYLSSRKVKEMLEMAGYDQEELKNVLREGPRSTREGSESVYRQNDAEFEMWIFHGHCAAEHLRMYGVDLDEDAEDKLPTMAVLINDRLVKITLSAMDEGEFPYDVLAWQRRPGLPWGVGVSRQIRTVQRILNGSVRAMMDNAGLSAAPQIILGNKVTPEDGNWTLYPGKRWRVEADAEISDVRQAFNAFVVPSVQQELMNIINWAMSMAEDTTGMPAMLQGIRGDAPDTLGGMQMQNNNATSVLRRLARRFDDYVTRPHIQRYFDWMMQYSEDEEIKGDFQVDVRASSALLERDSQQSFLMQMLALSKDPTYGLDPARLMLELLKGQRLDPERVSLTEEQKQAQAQQQPQQDPTLAARADLLKAQAQQTQAKTAVEHVKVAVEQARAEHLQAQAATTNVEGMYSATEAAKNLLLAAPVAGAADAIWKSGGGQDKDLPPALPQVDAAQVAGRGEVPPPQTNTNPLTPANPASPATGMMEGIEGGGSHDPLPM